MLATLTDTIQQETAELDSLCSLRLAADAVRYAFILVDLHRHAVPVSRPANRRSEPR